MHRIPFRNRSHEVSRIEAFSDVIFGFAISLLVVSLEPPRSYGQLMEMMHGMAPFAFCFFLFILIWFEHHRFFRRYGPDDMATIVLNTLLLFVILWYVYPMRFVLTLAARSLTGEPVPVPLPQGRTLFTIYGLGFTAIFWLLGGMYAAAYRRRHALQLNDVEQTDTLESVYDNLATGAFGLLSAALAHTAFIQLAGLCYFLMFIPKTMVPWIMGRKRERQEAAMLTQP